MTPRGRALSSSEQEITDILHENTREPRLVRTARAIRGAIGRLSATLWAWPRTHRRLSFIVLFAGLFGLALWSRYRYILGDYTYTFGSGDAYLILVKALFLREGIWRPSPELVPVTALFDQPPLIPFLFGGVSFVTSLPLTVLPFIIVPLLTSVALLAFFGLVRRTFDLPTAVISTGLLAVLPRFSLDSTQPEKAPFVVSFAIISLWLMVKSSERRWLLPLAGLLLGFSVFSHTTGYFFVPIFAVSYFAVHGFSRRRAFDPLFLLSLAIPALFIGAYFLLAKLDQPAASAGVAAGEAGFLPSFMQTYVNSLLDLFNGGIGERAWNLYFDAIRQQLTTPVYIAAIAGFGLAVLSMIRSRRPQMLPVAFWMVIVTLGFAMQFPGSSHGSRYPHYVTPAFLVMAAYFLVASIRWLASHQNARLLVTPAVAVLIIVVVGMPAYTYATASNPGLQGLLGGHRDLANFITEEGLLDDGSHILYLGWPSVTLYLLEHDIRYQYQIHSFGFGLRDLDEFTPDFIRANNIRYYADNHIANDGFASSAVVMTKLQPHFHMRQIDRFERRRYNHVTLFEIGVGAQHQQGARRYLQQPRSEADSASLATNPSLVWTAGGANLPGWSPNGSVQLKPLDAAKARGVMIRNTNAGEFAGIRQLIDARPLRGQTITAIVTVRGVGPHPARSAVVALGHEGGQVFSQMFVPLEADEMLITLEAELPQDIEVLRITVATGRGDAGDLAIQQVHLIAEPLEQIVELLREEQRASAE